jgi:hypothetical protein
MSNNIKNKSEKVPSKQAPNEKAGRIINKDSDVKKDVTQERSNMRSEGGKN